MPYVGVGAQSDSRKNLMGKPMAKVYGILALAGVFTVALGFLGHYHHQHPIRHPRPETIDDVHNSISEHLMNSFDPEKIKANLRLVTKEPHVAGTDANKRVAYNIAQLWKENGLEDVHFVPYEVLLSYPDYDNPNHVTILDASGREIFKSSGESPVIFPDEQGAKHAGVQWLAYAAEKTAQGNVVYVNHGTETDFENLDRLGVSVKNSIVLMRYGNVFRANKVKTAQDRGAIGVILFSDPQEAAKEGTDEDHVYPKTVWMPNEGVQRGTIMHGDGDPLTPLYPAKKGIYRSRTFEEARQQGILPSIPALPISYSTAYKILSRLSGRAVPLDWQGGLNVTYRTGPTFKSGERVKIDVRSKHEVRKIRNVVGYIRGTDEPDRYVILGNHFDAWVYGSIDPNSGTAILAEVARVMTKTINETSWRPARTIVFINWDAEEYGLIGSTEFVEDFADLLAQRTLVYLNMDCFGQNASLHVSTVPGLFGVSVDVSKKIPNPLEAEKKKGRATLYDTWVRTFPSDTPGRPKMPIPSGGSDHASFLNYIGVPVVDIQFRNKSTDTYPLYHTLYETPFVNEHLLDSNNMAVHVAVGRYWTELARTFVDSPVVPINATDIAIVLQTNYIAELKEQLAPLRLYRDAVADAKQQLSNLIQAAQEFYQVARQFGVTVGLVEHAFSLNPYDFRQLSAVNERLMRLERCFINPRGIPNQPHSRHVLFSISDKDSYSSTVMAGVYEEIYAVKAAKTPAERNLAGRRLAQQISIVQYSVQCATNTLRDHI